MLPLPQVLSQIPLLSSFLNHQHPSSPYINKAPSIAIDSSCPNPPTLSCPSSPPDSINTCCINHPSGHFLQTQFWDTSPPVGPNTSWTIHGLWPDLCTGGFDAFCDSSRSHSDIRGVLHRALDENEKSSSAVDELLKFMDTYWLSMDGNDENLWAHEWNKHGTCISTLEPDCYPSPFPSLKHRHHHLDVLDYFVHTTSLFRTLDTYAILADSEILPSHTKRYTLRDLEDALSSSAHGHSVTFRCNQRGELDEVWYHFSVMGSLRHSEYTHAPSAGRIDSDAHLSFLNASTVGKHFIPAAPDGILSNCPKRGIKYLPKTPSNGQPAPSPTRSTTHPISPPTSTAAPFTGKGHLEIHILDTPSSSNLSPADKKGCLIRHGEWYLSGTCATFRSKRDVVDPGHQPLFSLSSSYSPCLVNPVTSKFECSQATAVQGIFSSSMKDEVVLAYRNQSVFYAEKVPSRFEKVDIFADDGDGSRDVQVEIHWALV